MQTWSDAYTFRTTVSRRHDSTNYEHHQQVFDRRNGMPDEMKAAIITPILKKVKYWQWNVEKLSTYIEHVLSVKVTSESCGRPVDCTYAWKWSLHVITISIPAKLQYRNSTTINAWQRNPVHRRTQMCGYVVNRSERIIWYDWSRHSSKHIE